MANIAADGKINPTARQVRRTVSHKSLPCFLKSWCCYGLGQVYGVRRRRCSLLLKSPQVQRRLQGRHRNSLNLRLASITSFLSGDHRGFQRLSPALPGLGRCPEDVGWLWAQVCGRELPDCGANLHRGELVGAAAGQAVGHLVPCRQRGEKAQLAPLAGTTEHQH